MEGEDEQEPDGEQEQGKRLREVEEEYEDEQDGRLSRNASGDSRV